MEQIIRKYPVGIQTFERIIRDEYIYIDKTDLVWQLAHYATFIFMNRPRRFGKSLLTSTLESYFKGDEYLFKGLKIMDLEKDWKQYPVIHLDLSTAKGQGNPEQLRKTLMWLMTPLVEKYCKADDETSPGKLLTGLIRRASQQENSQVVVLIDEYDAPLLDVLHDKESLDGMRNVMQELYQPLKANEALIKFCFITGVTRLSQLSIFSTLNNLTNVSLNQEFSAICGITEKELHESMQSDLAMLAKKYKCDSKEIAARLKIRYDGYHFSEESPEVYNPFSLMSAFANKRISNYWFETGTPTFLIRMMRHFNFNITEVDNIETTDYAINRPTEAMTSVIPLLYQTGYLTIKDYDSETEIYTLSIPNQEVRIGYTDGLLPAYVGLDGEDVQVGFAMKFWKALKADDINLAMQHMQAYLAGIPYIEGFKKKLAEAANAEGFYEYTLYLIFSMLNVYVRTQVKVANGRTDMVVLMPKTTYVFEFKVGASADEALKQIDDKGYALPYKSDGKNVVKVGVSFNKDTRTIDNWKIG